MEMGWCVDGSWEGGKWIVEGGWQFCEQDLEATSPERPSLITNPSLITVTLLPCGYLSTHILPSLPP